MIIPERQITLGEDVSKIEKMDGKLSNSLDDNDKLLKSVLENDAEQIKDGKVLNDMMNQGLSSFQPDIAFDQLCKNYKNAKNIYGESLLSEVTGYETDFIERNMNIPEFQRELKSKMNAKVRELQDKDLLSYSGEILDTGFKMAALSLYVNELNTLVPRGLTGEHFHKKPSHYGSREESRAYIRGDRFRNLAARHSVKTAVRRGHQKLHAGDLRVFERQSKGEICIVYGIDASGSMRGKKIEVAKKAGVALAYKATQNRDKVGIMVFSDNVKQRVYPTVEFFELLSSITTITASKQTDIAKTIENSIEMFPLRNVTKHLILLTDAESTVGDDPKKKAFEAASMAAHHGISISIIGIKLDEGTTEFSRRLAEIGNGKLYVVSDLENLDKIILHDYERLRE